ncbi:MAG: hypothetical protein AABX65_03725 [Nanoarchaeota archaeon]
MGEGGGTGTGVEITKRVKELILMQDGDFYSVRDEAFYNRISKIGPRKLVKDYGLFRFGEFRNIFGKDNCLVLHHESGTTVRINRDMILANDEVSIIGWPEEVEETRETLENLAGKYNITLSEIPEERRKYS